MLAKAGDGADLYVVANSFGQTPDVALDARPRVVYSHYKTQKLGELLLRFDGRAVAGATNRYVVMNDPIPRDPLANKIVDEAAEAVRAERERRFASQ